MTIQQAIQSLIDGRDLGRQEAREVMDQIMSGEATPAQIGAFLVALRCKGETVAEIAGCAEVMREKATRVRTRRSDVVDTCGTGGDGSGTFNISTTVAFVAAGAGLCVAKHGNRAMSSRCGSADVLQALGVNTEASPEVVGRCLDEVGIGFLFAPLLHGAMKHAVGPRREIGTRTVFNVLGPLTNPAGARRQLVGVYAAGLTDTLAGVLRELGTERAFVVHGSDGLDEITVTGPTRISVLRDGKVTTGTVEPREFGLAIAPGESLKGGTPEENAAILTAVLEGEPGPRREVVLLNAAAAVVAGGRADTLAEGLERARESVDSGAALHALQQLRRASQG
ncbi:MAG: anthranilate phosphoribosyltransferase [Candidatus Latescibacterota bacterium]|jgi:anthranilate phosphoribosyltransferase